MPIRVLLVDDVPDLRTLIRVAMARQGGFEVVGEADDGEMAILLAGKLRPDVVLMDLAMPKMSGLEAIPKIYQASPGSRILVLSGFASRSIAEQAVNLCAMAYLEKGVPAQQILDMVESIHTGPPKDRACVEPAA